LRILLDENVPVQLKGVLRAFEVKSVNDWEVGWKAFKNGRLLMAMEGRFDLLITADRNMYAQQTLDGRAICILVLPTNRRKVVLDLGETIAAAVAGMAIGDYAVLEMTGAVVKRSFGG
jgi:hypothetical protein